MNCTTRIQAILLFLLIATVEAAPPDLTNGGVPDPEANESSNLGPTGLRGWIYHVKENTGEARQILVDTVDAGSPADGVIQVGDVILGADGSGGTAVAFTSDARKSLAQAIADAEERDPGTLDLLVWRPGSTSNYQITLETMGAYSATAPYNCPKSAKILEQGIDHYFTNEDSGRYSFGAISLLAANDPADPDNAARMAQAQTEAQALIPDAATMAQLMSDEQDTASMITWQRGHKLILLAEYYLVTGDATVLPAIEAYAVNISKNQSLYGTVGHKYADRYPDGSNGPMGGVYGAVNSAALPCFLGVLLAKECEAASPGSMAASSLSVMDAAIERSSRFLAYYAGKGAIPYGEGGPYYQLHETNGKSGLAALCFALQANRVEEGKFYAKMATAASSEREKGHTGSFFNYLWAPLGAAMGGEEAAVAHFSGIKWMLDLNRNWDGGFDYDCLNGQGPDSGSEYNNFRMSTAALLTYALPLRQLHLTGRGQASGPLLLSSGNVAEAQFSDTYDPTSRSKSELMGDLASWSPKNRLNAATELATRSIDSGDLSQLETTATDTGASASARDGACLALGTIADPSTTTTLVGLLTDADPLIRLSAANGLRKFLVDNRAAVEAEQDAILQAAASTATPLFPINDEDPLQMAHGRLSMLLFYSGNSYGEKGVLWGNNIGDHITGVDRNLLYPAIEAVSGTAHGQSRSTLKDTFYNLTPEDVEALAGTIVDTVRLRAPADKMFSHGARQAGIDVLQQLGYAEGVPLSVIYIDDEVRNTKRREALPVLERYAGSCLTVNPDPDVVGFCEFLISSGSGAAAEAQLVLDAIAADTNPATLTPFKSIQSVSADDTTLILPSDSTVLRVSATDFAQGDSIFTWELLYGPGNVSFSENGTAAAANTTVQFDPVPGWYYFQVTMSDSRGLTEVSETIEVTVGDTDTTAPSIAGFSPAHAATDAPAGGALVLSFDENVQKGSGNIVIQQSGGGTFETIDVNSAGVSISGAQVTITPGSALAAGTVYYVEIDSGAFEDSSGNPFGGISGNGSWSFITASATIGGTVASWDTWTAATAYDADFAQAGITASLSEIDNVIRDIDTGTGSTDGTFGSILSGADTGAGRMRIEKGDAGTGDFAINIANASGGQLDFDELLFDFEVKNNTHDAYSVVFENLTQSTTSGVLGSATGLAVGWQDVDIDASSITLADGDSGRFVISLSGAPASSTSSGIFDNIAVTASGSGGGTGDGDSDGMTDAFELLHTVPPSATGLNPGDDLENGGAGDGLTNLEEFQLGTNPSLSDSDGDGAGDWYEVTASFTDPLDGGDKPNVPYPLPDPDAGTGTTAKPVKVYIISGQSNMVGYGRVDGAEAATLETISKAEGKFPNLVEDGTGDWAVRNDVHYRGVIDAIGNAGLQPGQGNTSTSFGPELGFGHAMGWHHDEPVLIIKSSAGGTSLSWEFIPPGIGQHVPTPADGNTYAGYGDSPKKWVTGETPVPIDDYGGFRFDQCFMDEADWAPPTGAPPAPVTNVTDILDNWASEYPQWAGQGFEIAGYAWFQGWNDGMSTTTVQANRYEENMAQFIREIRDYYEARYPTNTVVDAPFVIATSAFNGWEADGNRLTVVDAQLAMDGTSGSYPEFTDNVKTMEARGYWRDSGPNMNQSYHYYHNAETYMLVGDALGRGMVELQSGGSALVTVPDLVGQPAGTAAQSIFSTGLVTGDIASSFSNTVPAGDVISQSPEGNNSAPAGSAVDFVVSLGPDPDSDPPVIVTLSPANTASDVLPGAKLVITFDEDVQKGSGNIVLQQSAGGTFETIDVNSAGVTIDGAEVTIIPAYPFASEVSYYVEIDNGAIEDVALTPNAFGGISGSGTWSFTVEQYDAALGVLFADNFDRADAMVLDTSGGSSTDGDINGSHAGKSGILGDLNWTCRAFSDDSFGIQGNALTSIGTGGANTNGGLVYINDHNFTDPIIVSEGGFSISVDINSYNTTGSGRRWWIGVGQSLAELAALTAAGDASDMSVNPADLLVGYRNTTDALEIYNNGVLNATETVTGGLPDAPATMRIDFAVGDFNAGSTVNYSVYFDGSATPFASGSFTWDANDQNYISVGNNLTGTSQLDNFEIRTLTPMTTVPDVTGLAQATAESNLTAANLVVGAVTTASSGSVPAGDVISQNPVGGTTAAEGSAVDLVVSLGASTTIPVTNPSFEADAYPSPGGSGLLATGWNRSGDPGTGRTDTPQYAGGVPDGVNYAWTNFAVDGFSQSLAVDLQANTTYTLTVATGWRADLPATYPTYPGYRIELWAGSTMLGFDADTTMGGTGTGPAAGTWKDVTVSYTSPASVTPGQALEIRLLAGNNVNGGNAIQTNYDHVRLTAAGIGGGNDFNSYISDPAFGLDPAEQGFALDPDGDGLANGLEAWFGTHPGEFNAGLADLATDGTTTTFTHPVNDNPPSDLSGFYQWSLNLVDWYACDGVDGPPGGPTVTAGTTTAAGTTTVTGTASEELERLFLRIGVSQD